MNAAQLHLTLNHLPLIGALVVALFLTWGLVRRSRDLLRASLVLTVVLAIMTYPVVLSGGSAEEMVEEAAWASETLIHEHEERGEKALIAMLLTGAVAAIGLWRLRGHREPDRLVPGITLALLVVSSGVLAWTALAGGEIRHDEIRSGAVQPAVTHEGEVGSERGEEDHR